MIVLMAVTTTLMTGPLIGLVERSRRLSSELAAGAVPSSAPRGTL